MLINVSKTLSTAFRSESCADSTNYTTCYISKSLNSYDTRENERDLESFAFRIDVGWNSYIAMLSVFTIHHFSSPLIIWFKTRQWINNHIHYLMKQFIHSLTLVKLPLKLGYIRVFTCHRNERDYLSNTVCALVYVTLLKKRPVVYWAVDYGLQTSPLYRRYGVHVYYISPKSCCNYLSMPQFQSMFGSMRGPKYQTTGCKQRTQSCLKTQSRNNSYFMYGPQMSSCLTPAPLVHKCQCLIWFMILPGKAVHFMIQS